MFAALVLRNVVRNLPRLLPMIVVLVVTFLALFIGNAILTSSDDALYRTYTAHVSGDLSVAAAIDNNFTIFGSDALLVGEYLVPPTIVNYDELRRTVDTLPEVRASGEIVSSAARVEIRRFRQNNTLFGVDFSRYFDLFPELEIVAGTVPPPGERGLVVQDGWARNGNATADLIGSPALLAVAHDMSFTIREIPVTGVFRYPVKDELLERVALVDPDTARALNGYIYGTGGVVDIPEADKDLFTSDFDEMFADAQPLQDEAEETTDAVDPMRELDAFFLESREEAISARRTVDGAWNFLLVSLYDRADTGTVIRQLGQAGFRPAEGFLVRDWRRTVGGTAQLVWYLQVMFNVGILFVAFGSAIITTNALVLSVLERTAEIGTMRALGATRVRVAIMITAETVIVVAGAAIAGVVLGGFALDGLNRAGVIIDNPYITILFGGEAIHGRATLPLVIGHVAAALALALVAVIYPLKRALGISPVKAMAA